MTNLLRWWLLFCTSIAALFTAHTFGFTQALVDSDVTRLSFVIIGFYLLGSMFVGWATYSEQKHNTDITWHTNIGWFMSESMLALGMIGTVIGFILMLGNSFESLNVSDTTSVKEALTDMALGMSTALYTTLVGLCGSQALKVQLVNAES